MVELGTDAGVHTVALLTDMDDAARAAPSATRSRSRESVEVLAGGGPADVVELTVALAREMLARRRASPTSTRPTRSPTAARWTPGDG